MDHCERGGIHAEPKGSVDKYAGLKSKTTVHTAYIHPWFKWTILQPTIHKI